MNKLKVIFYSLILIASMGSLSYADSNEVTLNRYMNSESSSFRVRRYDGLFMPKVEYQDFQEALKDKNIILEDLEIEERNIDFDQDINGSGINREFGGDVVGNGGGSLEHFAYYFFYNIPSLIESSLAQTLIYFDEKERLILQGIRLAFEEMDKEDKFIFARGDQYESFFFNEEIDRAPRMAKTGFDINYPIYINIDRAYEMVDQDPRLWIGLLIHELGHQIGFADHTFLDQLGNKVIAATTFNTQSISVHIPDGRELKLIVQNYAHKNSISELYMTMGHTIMSVQDWKSKNFLEYSCGSRLFHDAQIENLHWETRGKVITQGLFRVKAKGWIIVTCKDAQNNTISNYTRDIEITINSGVGSTMISGNVDIL